MVVAPWPKNCRVYQHDNGCNRYEISRDNKKVDSCDLKFKCNFTQVTPSCQEYYNATADANMTTRFIQTGRQCFFKESIYPKTPWPNGCKIY